MNSTLLSDMIRMQAESLKIDALGFASANEFEGYLLKHSKRRDPRNSLPNAKTIIVAGIYIGGNVLPSWHKPYMGRTSRLFLSGFFNNIVKQLEPISALLQEKGYTTLICDDSDSVTSILPLKLAAIRAGLGWQGKNSLLVTRQYGTFIALGGIITDADLEHNTEQEPNRCKGCTKCQQACPMGALEQPHVLEREKCLSHLLQNDNLPEAVKPFIKNQVMDCEICQQVCPWNFKHIANPLATRITRSFQEEIPEWEDFFVLSNLVKLTEQEYKNSIDHLNTGIPFSIFHRNVLIAVERLQKYYSEGGKNNS